MEARSSHVDKLKQPLPYLGGFQIDIRRHIPPPPMGADYKWPQRRQPLSYRYVEEYKTASNLCLACPTTETPPHPDQSVHRLTIVSQIACGETRGPQVVTCRMDDQEVVRAAKIFDPLYYDFYNEADPTYYADNHYSTEAAAYCTIRDAGLDGKYTPRYHDAWTCEMPFLDGQHRHVRMIIMDHIPHPSMKELLDSDAYKSITPDLRMQALVQAVESYRWLAFHGVRQEDLAPRNVMIDHDESRIGVTIIDFSHAMVRDLPNSKWVSWPPGSKFHRYRPDSPIDMFAFEWLEFHQWVPEELHERRKRVEWLTKQWGDSDIFEAHRRKLRTEDTDDEEDDDE